MPPDDEARRREDARRNDRFYDALRDKDYARAIRETSTSAGLHYHQLKDGADPPRDPAAYRQQLIFQIMLCSTLDSGEQMRRIRAAELIDLAAPGAAVALVQMRQDLPVAD